jgi:hypothetical protein
VTSQWHCRCEWQLAADTGVLVYGTGYANEDDFKIAWVDRQGGALGTVGPVGSYRGWTCLPTGRVWSRIGMKSLAAISG